MTREAATASRVAACRPTPPRSWPTSWPSIPQVAWARCPPVPAGRIPAEPNVAYASLGMNNAAVVVVPLAGQENIHIDIDGAIGSAAHIRVVVLGYYVSTGGSSFTAVNPCAVFDTRATQGAPDAARSLGKRDGGSTTTYQISRQCRASRLKAAATPGRVGCQLGATAVLINLVAANIDNGGNLRVYATGTVPQGGVLELRQPGKPAMNNANAVVVPLSMAGQLSVDVNTGQTNVPAATDIRGVALGYYTG